MLFQAKIHEREDEGSDGRAGLGWAEGALGEEGAGREGLWSSSLAQTPWGVRWAGGHLGWVSPHLVLCAAWRELCFLQPVPALSPRMCPQAAGTQLSELERLWEIGIDELFR